MKVAVLIPAHCHAETLLTTVGTWLRHKSYEATLAVAIHDNYQEMVPGEYDRIVSEMPFARIVRVPEIDWHAGWDPMRYSRMHSRSLSALLDTVTDEDYVAIFDHDLYFHGDFVSWGAGRADVFCSMLNDQADENNYFHVGGWGRVAFRPKPSVWHMLLSGKAARRWRDNPEAVAPNEGHDGGVVIYDTTVMAFEKTEEWGMTKEVVTSEEMSKMVRHEWSMSLNFGMSRSPDYEQKVREVKDRYAAEFPDGIGGL
jgi:hypothetical protein